MYVFIYTALIEKKYHKLFFITAKGDIYFKGGPRTESIVRTSAYVMQDNVHIGSLTVRQTLSYAAHLRMDSNLSDSVKVVFLNYIITYYSSLFFFLLFFFFILYKSFSHSLLSHLFILYRSNGFKRFLIC